MDGARDRLHENGEVITGRHFADSILKGLPYEYVRNCNYNQRGFGLEDIKRTLQNIYGDNLARTSSNGNSGGSRGVAVHAQGDSSGVKYFDCSEYGHYSNECPQNSGSKKRRHNRGNPLWKKNGCGGASAVEEGVATAVTVTTWSRRQCSWPWTRRGS